MLPYAATSRWAAPVFAPMSVIGPMRMLVLRQLANPTKVRAVGTQLAAQDSRTTARRWGGLLRESHPDASAAAATTAAVPAKANHWCRRNPSIESVTG